MRMTRRPLSTACTGFSFTRTPKFRMGLPGLDERPSHVVVADEPHLQRDPGGLGVADGGDQPGVGDRDHHVGVHAGVFREALPQLDPRLVDVPAEDAAVGPREVDVLEDALRDRRLVEDLQRVDAVAVDPDHLARLDVADVLAVEQVERAGLRADHVAVAGPAEQQPAGNPAGPAPRRARPPSGRAARRPPRPGAPPRPPLRVPRSGRTWRTGGRGPRYRSWCGRSSRAGPACGAGYGRSRGCRCGRRRCARTCTRSGSAGCSWDCCRPPWNSGCARSPPGRRGRRASPRRRRPPRAPGR